MRKVKFLCDYFEFKKGQIVNMNRGRADRLLIAMIVVVVC
jgi:hypothetical protein